MKDFLEAFAGFASEIPTSLIRRLASQIVTEGAQRLRDLIACPEVLDAVHPLLGGLVDFGLVV